MKLFLLFFLLFYACSTQSKFVPAAYVKAPKPISGNIDSQNVILGVENFLKNHIQLIKDKRVGLVTNQSGVNRQLQSTADLFFNHPEINLTALFGPEHGIRGDIFAGNKVVDQTDPKTGLPIYSLYGKTRKPTFEMFEDIDVIFFDIQDVGTRSYTYISTMGHVIEAAAEFDKEVIILDRPNPMGGTAVEGGIVYEGYFSLVSYYPIAYRHGMTIGEIAKMHNEEKNLGAKLTVIPLLNWQRNMYWPDTGLPWVPTSPHVPNWESVMFLATTGTFGELHTLSEGVGYTMPFEYVGAPWVDAEEFSKALNAKNLAGVIFRPAHFRPYYFRLKDQICQGVQIHIIDFRAINTYTTGLHLMKTAMELYPDQDLFANEKRIRSFNLVMGNDKITNGLKNGLSVSELEQEWQQELSDFLKIRQKYLLY